MAAGASARAAAPAIVLAALLLIPFLGKAFTIDDPLFLYQARHVLDDPLHPTAFPVVWSIAPQRMSAIMASGPGMAYLLVPCVALGGAEWAAHLVQLVALALAAWGTASLTLRWGAGASTARTAALLLAASPAVLGMAGTAMPDVPAMAFGVWGIERAAAWSRGGRAHQAASAVLCLAVAALCRSQLIVLTPLAMLACAGDPFHPRGWVWRRAIPLAAAPAVAWLVFFITRDPEATASAVAGAARMFLFAPAVARNVVSFFTHWALVLPLALPWLLAHPRRILTSPVIYVASALAFWYIRSTPEVGPIAAAPAAGLGAAVIWDLVRDAWSRRDGVQIVLGCWLFAPAVIVPYLHLPSKYLVAAAPAAAIAVARTLAPLPAARARAVVAATLVPAVLLGVAILRADAVFAGLGRRAAAELVAPRIAEGGRVWFNGHWGFQWYAEKAGARPLTQTRPHPEWKDHVVSSAHAEGELMGALPRRRLVATVDDVRPGGRIMTRALGAGFFSNGWGYLPWSWGNEPVDRYELWVLE